jgi:hypothetical protein
VKSEVDLWSELTAKLTATDSIPEAMTAYQQCVTHRMQMAAEDGRRLYEDCQKITHKITESLSHGLPTTSSRKNARYANCRANRAHSLNQALVPIDCDHV